MISPISFKAQHITNTQIMRIDDPDNAKVVSVAFVELNPLDNNDLNAIKLASTNWNSGESYASYIVDDMGNCFNKKEINDSEHFYALTRQKTGFDNLDFKKILGVAQIKNNPKETKIYYLQTNPEYISRNNSTKFKYIGSGILDCIKKISKAAEITLNAAPSAIPFYEKNNFRMPNPEKTIMTYTPHKPKRTRKIFKSISFKANFINSSTVKKLDKKGVANELKVSFVELNPFSKNDVKAILEIKDKWKKGDEFAKGIAKSIQTCYEGGMRIPDERYFALTEQEDDFLKLDSNKILGLAETSNFFTEIQVDYIQTNPRYISKKKPKEFKHIGTAILNSLKQLFPENGIFLNSSPKAIPFYEKNGFELIDKDNRAMVYDPLDIKA